MWSRKARPHDAPGRSRAGLFDAGRNQFTNQHATRLESRLVAVLEGKTAVVTGASSGIGAATARPLRREGARVAGGARRVDRLAEGVARSSSTSPTRRAARLRRPPRSTQLGGLDILVNAAGLALGRDPFDEVDRGGRADRARDERQRADPHDAPLPAAHPRRRAHRQHRLDRRPAGVPEAARSTSPRSSPCAASPTRCARICSAARSASRPSTPASSRPSSRWSASAATRRRRQAVYEGVEPLTRRRHRRLHPVRAHAAAARERRRDRRQGARAVERRPHPPRTEPDGVTLTILEGSTFCICDERGDIGDADERLLRRRHALPLALRLTINGERAAAALVGQGRVLLGRVLPAQPARRRRCRRTRSRSRASASSATAMQDRIVVQNQSDASRSRSSSALEIGTRLRGHLRRQGARLRARRPAARAAAAAARAEPRSTPSDGPVRARRPGRATPRRRCILSPPGERRRRRASLSRSSSQPRERWELRVDVVPSPTGDGRRIPSRPSAASARSSRTSRDSLAAWQLARAAAARRPGTTSSTRSAQLGRRPRRAAHARQDDGLRRSCPRPACRGS